MAVGRLFETGNGVAGSVVVVPELENSTDTAVVVLRAAIVRVHLVRC